ncbi:MAG: bifunctional sterol desaturase/short chain dehydrogenase [Oscillatoriales cyanobacterium SM2_2_1]|nr:bifunctional sterol desaturase/short chain dehydrogenase [Oscillatoriales cyanobacterium SM2_2_1]
MRISHIAQWIDQGTAPWSSVVTVGLWFSIVGFGSVVLAELVRDCYHLAGHYVPLLQRAHGLHHRAYRPDLSKVSLDLYRRAELVNDVPEAAFMVLVTALAAWGTHTWALTCGILYSLIFLITSLARSCGWWLATDLTHAPGALVEPPGHWLVNRTYHWRHHFDQPRAYYCSTFTFADRIMGTSLSFKGKTIGITGASGSLGRSLILHLLRHGAKVIALTTSPDANFGDGDGVHVVPWQAGQEEAALNVLPQVDILILNHGINVYGARDCTAIASSYEVNTFATWRLMEAFLTTVQDSRHIATKEVWVNTSEAEVSPALSPLYELSKRAIGDLVTLRRLDAPCVIRKLILGPFRSKLNPYGVMAPSFVAWAILFLARRDFRNIIVTINPFTYFFFPLKEWSRSLYFWICSRPPHQP